MNTAYEQEAARAERWLMGEDRFPLLGFPNETNEPMSNVVYQCFFRDARIALWERRAGNKGYALNLYMRGMSSRGGILTDARQRYNKKQQPIEVSCAFEAQLAINYLIQTYLPAEVTEEVDGTTAAGDAA